MLHLNPANPPPHDFADLRRGLDGCQSTPPGRDGQCERGACYADATICVCRLRAHSTTTTFFHGRDQKNSTQNTRVSTKHTAVSSMLHLQPANPPPRDLAGPNHGRASSSLRHRACPSLEIVIIYNGVVCTYDPWCVHT